MKYTDAIKSKLQQFGALGYEPDRIASLMRTSLSEADLKQLMNDLNTPGSDAHTEYQSGADAAQLDRDTALHNLALSNNPKARQAYEQVAKAQKLDTIIHEKFGIPS